jgi:hypothetical protein
MTIVTNPFRFPLLLLVSLLVSSAALAQPNDDEFNFDEIPLDEGALPYIGVGGGYVGFVSLMNFDALNALGSRLGMGSFDGQFWMHGGGGWTVVGLIPNLRIGVYGAAGSKVQTANPTIAGESYKRTLRYSVGVTTGHVDYVIPILTRGFAIVPGVMVGAGSDGLKLVQTRSDGEEIDNVFGGYAGFASDTVIINPRAANTRQTNLERSYLFLYPGLNIEYALTQFVMLRLGGGYHMSRVRGDWNDTEGTVVTGISEDLKPDGVMLHFGVFLGLFQQ